MRVTDDFCYDLFHAHRSENKRSCEKTRCFPYVETLRDAKEAIIEAFPNDKREILWDTDSVPPFGLSKTIPGDKEPWDEGRKFNWGDGEPIFGFWKARLCIENFSGFEFVQVAEARTRFFAGMMWSARWSLTLIFLVAAFLVARESPTIKLILYKKEYLRLDLWGGVCIIILFWLAVG